MTIPILDSLFDGECLVQRMEKLAALGWEVTVQLIAPGEWQADAEMGQIQCPHEGRYNPENGHGYSLCSTGSAAQKVFKETGSVLTFTTARAAMDELDRQIAIEMQRPLAAVDVAGRGHS